MSESIQSTFFNLVPDWRVFVSVAHERRKFFGYREQLTQHKKSNVCVKNVRLSAASLKVPYQTRSQRCTLTVYFGRLPMGVTGPRKIFPGTSTCKTASKSAKPPMYCHATAVGAGQISQSPATPFSAKWDTRAAPSPPSCVCAYHLCTQHASVSVVARQHTTSRHP